MTVDTFNGRQFSDDVHKSLRELNLKENDYILVADKTPPNYRGTTSLAFLQAIQWTAVFDLFDPKTKEDGLYFILNKTSDSAPFTNMELGDFKNDEEKATYDRTWIIRNQTMHDSSWIHNSSDCLRQAMWLYHKRSRKGRIHCVFFVLSDENLKYMADIIETCVKIIGPNANKCITILSEKKENGDALTKIMDSDARKDLRNPCCLFGFPLQFLRESVKDMLGDFGLEDANATTELPFWNGKNIPILNRQIKSLTDLEVYVPKPKFACTIKELKNARDNFYKGEVIKQINLNNKDDIERTLANDLTHRIDQSLQHLSKASPEDTTSVKVVPLSYESGSGATTLGRRVLWDKKSSCRCAVVKSISDNTYKQIQKLQSLGYETIDHELIPPILVLVDNEREHDFDNLYDTLVKKNVKCVLLKTVPKAGPVEKEGGDDCLNLGTLDTEEVQRVKKILSILEGKDDQEKDAAVKIVENEKRFIWLGLQLFGQDYKDIRKRLSKHINNTISHNVTDNLKSVYEKILRFCCLLAYYGKEKLVYPHPCIADILYYHQDLKPENTNQIKKIHDTFGGLLLDGYNEGYHGWRPAHFLVAELVHEEMDFVETAKQLVRTMNKGKAYAQSYLINKTVDVFLNRDKTSESPLQNISESDFFLDSEFVDSELDSVEVQMKYSTLVMAAMSLNESFPSNIISGLDLLVTLIENVHTTQHQSRTWQQIARVFAYEIGTIEISEESIQPLVERLNEQLRQSDQSLNCTATNGFAMAHQIIDHAINLQKDFVNHLVMKATFFKLELLSLYKHAKDITASKNKESKDVMIKAISTTKRSIQAHDIALEKDSKGYLHAMVGKIETIILLLQIFKTHSCFTQSDEGPDESFKNYITFGDHPEALKAILTEDDLNYFHSLATKAIHYINEFFEELQFHKKRLRKHKKLQLNKAKMRAKKIRKLFYQVTQRNRRLVDYEVGEKDILCESSNEGSVNLSGSEEDIVQDLLFVRDETAFSTWKNLKSNEISRIYSLLNDAISKGPVSKESMLIFARAALEKNVTVDDLFKHIQHWYKHFPKSIWCHLFNYMIHFPVPSGALKSNVPIVKKSAEFCKRSGPRIQESYRNSGAEYLLGKGTGLNVILPSHKVSQGSVDDKSDFWRRLESYEQLERLRGEKVLGKKGVLTYKSIEIIFDNDRYPKESRDELWFCLGFTLNGPYAYDPIDEDTYRRMEADFEKKKKNGASSQESRTGGKNAWQRIKPGPSGNQRPIFDRETSETSDHRKKKPNSKDMKSKSEKEIPVFPEETKHIAQCVTTDTEWKSNPKLEIRSRAQEGHQQTFKPIWIDAEGKVHHGAVVKGAKKSSICQRHQQKTTIDPLSCPFAHPWIADLVQQTVCYDCTRKDRRKCVAEGNKHSRFIYKLGDYRNEFGGIWQK